jgi:hypothetical protein
MFINKDCLSEDVNVIINLHRTFICYDEVVRMMSAMHVSITLVLVLCSGRFPCFPCFFFVSVWRDDSFFVVLSRVEKRHFKSRQ